MTTDPTPRFARAPVNVDTSDVNHSHRSPQGPPPTKLNMLEDKWFQGIQACEGGFLIPGLPRRHTFDLFVLSDAVYIRSENAEARFEWRHYGPHTSARPTSWNFTRFIGMGTWAISADPDTMDRYADVLNTRNDLRNRMLLALDDFDAFPLHLEWFVSPLRMLERTVFISLMSALREHSKWRERLEDFDRVQHLCNDVRNSTMRAKKFPSGVRPAHAEVSAALRALGYTHRIGGRPLPDDEVVPCEQVVHDVRLHIDERPQIKPYVIPYRPLEITNERIRSLAQSEYCDVEPWPFYALADNWS